jgi:hypothetical protein
MEKKPIKITFAPDAFADFEGTQEELDEFVEKLKEMITDEGFLEELGKYEEIQVDAVELNLSEEETEIANKKRLH